jgi:hypothetical protein
MNFQKIYVNVVAWSDDCMMLFVCCCCCQCHVLLETLRVYLKKLSFWIHLAVHCSIGWEPIGTFHFFPQNAVVLISDAHNYINAIRWLIVWPNAMPFCSYFIQISLNFKNHFLIHFNPKNLKIFYTCSQMSLEFNCEF